MRFLPFVFVISVALVSCGGGGASTPSSAAVASHVTATFPPVNGLWSASLGPWSARSSGKLNAIVVDPSNADTMYVAGGIGSADGVTTDTGIFKTTNGGASWTAVNAGVTDTTINSLSIDANGALLAATEDGGMLRSIDGAASWHQVSSALRVRQIIHTSSGYRAAAADGLYVSSDGTAWTLAATTRVAANCVGGDGANVYLGLIDGTIARVQNGAVTYLATLPTLDAPPVVHAIAVDPQNSRSIYASLAGIVDGIYSDALFHSADSGTTWTQVVLPASLRGAQAIAFSRATPHRLYVAGTGLAYTDDGRSFAQAQGYGDARSLDVLANDQIAIASDQGVAFGSYGSAFTPMTAGLPINIVRSVAVSGSSIVVTMQDFPPARSLNAGTTWQTLTANSSENGTAYINPNSPNLCYIVDGAVNVSTDGCASFSSEAIGGYLSSTQPIATVPNSVRTYALSSSGPAVADDGIHFTAVSWPVPGPVDLAIDPHNGSSLFVSSAAGGVRVWHSSDGGASFSPSASLAPPGPSYPNDAPALAVDPTNSNTVIAVTETAVYRSTDGGATFTPLRQTMQQFSARVRRNPDALSREISTTLGYNIGEHVAFAQTGSQSLLLISNGGGAFASTDDGTTLHAMTSGAISHAFEGFAVDGNHVCTGTDGQGVICTTTPQLAAIAQ